MTIQNVSNSLIIIKDDLQDFIDFLVPNRRGKHRCENRKLNDECNWEHRQSEQGKNVVCLVLTYTTICNCPTSCFTSLKEYKQSIELHIPMCYTIYIQ